MANEESLSKRTSPLKIAFSYSACSVMVIAILVLVTEILRDATILHNTMLLLVGMAVCALVPFTVIFIRSEGLSYVICRISLFLTLALAIINFYFRAKVSKFYVEDGYGLTKEDLQAIASSTSPNGVVILLNNQNGFVFSGIEGDSDAQKVQSELKEIVAKPEQVKELGLEETDTHTKSQLDAVKKWSKVGPKIIYNLKTDEKSQSFPDYTILGPESTITPEEPSS